MCLTVYREDTGQLTVNCVEQNTAGGAFILNFFTIDDNFLSDLSLYVLL